MAKVGDVRSDGKIYTGPTYGWQSPGTVWKRTPGKAGEEKTIGGVTKVYTGPKYGWQTKETIKSRQQPAKPEPAPEPTKPAPAPAQPAKPAPAQPSGGAGGGGGSTPSPAPTKPAPAAPKPSPVADYMKAAAAARKSGDPAQMAKVRDMGMDIWRKSNPKLAAAADERSRTRGTSATTNPLMSDMKSGLPAPTPKVTVSTDKEVNKVADTLSKTPVQTKPNTYGTTMGAGPTFRGGPVPPPIKDNKNTRKEAYDVVLDYLLSEGHADTLSEAHYVMMQMDSEYIQNILQERAWWDPAGLFMSKREREVEKAKSTATGNRASYDPNTGRTYNPSAKDQSRATGVIAPRGGVVGTMEPGKPETWQRYAPGSDPYRRQNIDRYVTVRGRDQLRTDTLANRAMQDKARRDAAADAAFDRKYADVYKNPAPEREGLGPRPAAPAPKPAAKPVATSPAAPKPKPQPLTIQSKNVTATGTSYERRTPTSAELAAAKAAGGGEAGVKAAVDVAKSNKVAATTPTPDLKPAAPKKQSLADTVKELQGMRKAAEERNK